MSEKLKVVWLCHLSSKELNDTLRPWKRIPEYAAWISSCIKAVEENPCFELHIVAPFFYIGHTHNFEIRGIHYHFYNPFLPLIGHPGLSLKGKNWFEYTDFKKTKRIVSRIINKINPDIIHLYGAENPYYSAAIIPLTECYPTILTIQGFISHTKQSITPRRAKRIEIERQVIQCVPICFCRSKAQANSVFEINRKMVIQPCQFCSYELRYDDIPKEKKYDIVFFASITKDKGIVDLLKAVAIIKREKTDVSVCVIGGGNYEQYVEMGKELGIDDNIIWTGFLPSRKDVHYMAAQCKISVLPTYNDMYPGTIIESMFLGIPVVSYNVDSNPEINDKYEAIRLVEVGNIESLAESIYTLLIDDSQRQHLEVMGKKRAYELFAPSNNDLLDQWMAGYKRAIDIYHKEQTQH